MYACLLACPSSDVCIDLADKWILGTSSNQRAVGRRSHQASGAILCARHLHARQCSGMSSLLSNWLDCDHVVVEAELRVLAKCMSRGLGLDV
jgi:hypothetical protein